GSNPCTVVSIDASHIECISPAQNSNPSTSIINIVSNNITYPSTLSIQYSSSITPTILSISPTSGSASQSLTISGSNFITGQSNVSIGGVSATIVSVTSSSITCTIPSIPAGNHPVIVQVSSIGISNSNIQFTYSLQLTNVTPNQGSYGGGQIITIIGDGLSQSTVAVTICNQ
ncbi:unnamed protein product, partial [Adineta ricciae]